MTSNQEVNEANGSMLQEMLYSYLDQLCVAMFGEREVCMSGVILFQADGDQVCLEHIVHFESTGKKNIKSNSQITLISVSLVLCVISVIFFRLMKFALHTDIHQLLNALAMKFTSSV